MLKGNLATRPFYNERLVTAAVALVALLVLVVSVFNVRALLALTRERAGLQAAISKDQMQADQFHTQARSLQQTVDREDLRTLAAETREANGLIDQRTFSWTTLLSVLEKKLPIDVRLIGIFPKIDHDYVEVTMTLTARRESDVQAFIAKLEEDGVFYDVLQREAQRNDDGTYDATVEAFYLEPGSVTTPKTPSAPAPAKPGNGRGGL